MRNFALIASWLVWSAALLHVSTCVLLPVAADADAVQARAGAAAAEGISGVLAVSFGVCLAGAAACIWLRRRLFVKTRRLSLQDGPGGIIWIVLAAVISGFLTGVAAPGPVLFLQGHSAQWAFASGAVAGILLLWAAPLAPREISPPAADPTPS
ncbi:MAG: hypothetical protein KA004_15590 [Verrucomicrobiales bacterium]|nr:hypothetical protein [Verrucomicrobiales bacterium]